MGKQAAAKPAAAKPAAAKPAAKASSGGKDKAPPKAEPKAASAKAGPSKADKAAKKSEKEAFENARLAARDAMMPPSESEEESEEEGGGGRRGGGKAAVADPEAERARAIAEREKVKAEAEAKAIRAEEAGAGRGRGRGGGGYPAAAEPPAGAARGRGRSAARAADSEDDDSEDDSTAPAGGAAGRAAKAAAALEKLLEKVAKGGKLSNKERRLHQKHLEKEEERQQDEEKEKSMSQQPQEMQQWLKDCENFSFHLPRSDYDDQGNAVSSSGDAVSIEGFGLSAPGNELLKDASLKLAKGHRYGLLGPNGMGKTTLLKHLVTRRFPIPASWTVALVQQEAAATERSVVEEVLCADVERTKLTTEEADLLEKIEASTEADTEELGRLCERLSILGADLEAMGAEAAESRVRQILIGLQFTEKMMEGKVKLLSGGWRMRVSLAKALFLAPDLLLLDEPTNHLDLNAVLWLDEFLSTEFKKTLLVVSHDADFLDSVCTDIVHLEDQKLWQYRGGYTSFKKMHAQKLQADEKEFKKLVEQGKKVGGNKTKQLSKEEIAQARPSKTYTVKFNFLPLVGDKDEAGISVHDVNFSYTEKKPWLLGPQLNFRVDASMRIAVVGKNGTGKSTLLNLLTKNSWPSEGEVQHSKHLTIGRYTQHFDELGAKAELTPVELLIHPEVRRFGSGVDSPQHAHKSLGQFGLPSHAHTRPIKELSGGQKARVQFALLTCRRPEILVLDEPTNHLDIESVEEIIAALKRYEGGFILVSHDARLITSTQAQLWELDGGGTVKSIGEGTQGFEKYRRSVLKELEEKRAQEERKMQKQMAERKRRRELAIAAKAKAKR